MFKIFRNLQIYSLKSPFPDALALDGLLGQLRFTPCGALDIQRRGFVAPGPVSESLTHTCQRQMLIALRVEEKKLPGEAVRRQTAERAAEIAAQQGFRPGRAQTREIREAVESAMLPKIPGVQRTTFAWVDPENQRLVVAGSPARAEELLEALHRVVDFSVIRTGLASSPRAALTAWLAAGEAPTGFTIDQVCELAALEKSAVRFVRHPLCDADILRLVEGGMTCTALAMTWADRVSFVLTEDFQIKRVTALDILQEELLADNADELFGAEFVLMSGTLGRLITELTDALGAAEWEAS